MFSRDLDISLPQPELLFELAASPKRIRIEPDPEPPHLDVLSILVERTTLLGIEEQIAVFDPNIAADLSAGQRHRLSAVMARAVPGNIVVLEIFQRIQGSFVDFPVSFGCRGKPEG